MYNYKFEIEGVPIKPPYEYEIGIQYISDAERTIDGTMLIDGVADKLQITMTYEEIDDAELVKILGRTWKEFRRTKRMKREITFIAPGEEEITMTAYITPHKMRRNQELAIRGKWGGFILDLIEV